MEKPEKENTTKLIHVLMLTSFFALCPAFFMADMSSAAPETLMAPQTFVCPNEGQQQQPDFTAPEPLPMPFRESSHLPVTNVRDEEPMLVLAQHSKAEEKKAPGAAPVRSKDITEEAEEEAPRIPDPLAPVNKLMFHVNDKLYFWALKPAAQVYSHIIPEDFRIVFSNAYDNLWAPSRIINNLLQFRLKAAGN